MSAGYDHVIEEIVQSVFSTMLDMDVARAEPAEPFHESPVAAVQIAGQWTGSVVLGLSPGVATAAAAAMLRIPENNVTEDDRREVAAELVNMIGGNLKSLLPAPSFLSLPTIVSGRDFGLHVHDAELVEEVTVATLGGNLRAILTSAAQPKENALDADVATVPDA